MMNISYKFLWQAVLMSCRGKEQCYSPEWRRTQTDWVNNKQDDRGSSILNIMKANAGPRRAKLNQIVYSYMIRF